MLFSFFFKLYYSEIEYSSCENNVRIVFFEDGSTQEFPCIFCPAGQYTTYNELNEEGNLSCSNCTLGTSNYGQDIILNSFSEKILSKFSFFSSSECT